MMSEDPYAAPTAPLEEAVPAPSENFASLAKEIFLSWEKLRIVYVLVLVVLSLLLVGLGGVMNLEILLILVAGAIAANVLYFAGPIVETYISWLGYRERWPRWFLFIGGTLLSMILAISVLLASG